MVAMLLWAWGAHAIPVALPTAPPGESQQVSPTPSFQFALDADTCLAPEAGLFSPGGASPYSMVIRDMLLRDTVNTVVLQVVVQPWISSPYSLRLEQLPQTRGARERPHSYLLRLVRAKGHPWAEMRVEMLRQQGDVIKVGDAEQKRALPAISRDTEVQTSALPAHIADRLGAVWAGALARTEYLNEITEAPDGSHLARGQVDRGISYNFWHDGRGGTTNSPAPGSLLRDLVLIVETLAAYTDSAPAAQPALLKRLDAELDGFLLRLKRNEACLRPRGPGVRYN
jgi:hypothetical protein